MPPLSSTDGFKAGGKSNKVPEQIEERIKTRSGKTGQTVPTGEDKEGGYFFEKIFHHAFVQCAEA
jgi:hypothetical protein